MMHRWSVCRTGHGGSSLVCCTNLHAPAAVVRCARASVVLGFSMSEQLLSERVTIIIIALYVCISCHGGESVVPAVRKWVVKPSILMSPKGVSDE